MKEVLPEPVLRLVAPLALPLLQLPQPTAPLLMSAPRRRLVWRDVTLHPRVLPASAALDVLPQGGTLPQKLLLPRAPHLVQVDGTFSLAEASGRQRLAPEDKDRFCVTACCYVSHVMLLSSTCVPAVCRPQPHSGRSSPSRKYFPSCHGDTPPLAPPSCPRRPGAPADLTGQKPAFMWVLVGDGDEDEDEAPGGAANVCCDIEVVFPHFDMNHWTRDTSAEPQPSLDL